MAKMEVECINPIGDQVRNNLYLLTVAAIAIFSLSIISCQSAGNNNAVSNQAANKAAANTAPTTATTPAAETSTSSTATPSDAYKAAYAARKNKDVPGLKKLMSKDIIEFFTEIGAAGDKKQTLDELLMELCEKPQAPTAETRNEKIDGDTATVEYLDEKGGWSTMDFVKEGGGWKLSMPKLDKADLEIGEPKKDNQKKAK